ncbi:MAG TPA: trehalose phosphatase, partial [Mycobacterium sp.]|nr:trehalose phosphatase [Mycobacterium sp.]
DGIGIVVRHSDDGDRATAARYALDSPAQVSEFTRRLARRVGSNS